MVDTDPVKVVVGMGSDDRVYVFPNGDKCLYVMAATPNQARQKLCKHLGYPECKTMSPSKQNIVMREALAKD